MTEADKPAAAPGSTAGAMLRAARERQGLHIAVLAAAIKVSPRKLDALEGDRYDELPDATFTRALAQTVCRALKIDSQPVMALLPAAATLPLAAISDGLNAPFRDRGGAMPLSTLLPRAPLLWAALALIVAAGLVLYWPLRPAAVEPPPQAQPALPPVLPSTAEPSRVGDAASGAAAMVSAPVVAAASPPLATPASSAAAATSALPPPTAASQPFVDPAARPPALPAVVLPSSVGASIAVSEPVWMEVVDGSGQVVFQRTIQPGENLNFEQKPPLKLKIGNAAAARLTFRGEPVDLTPHIRSNVARIELK